MANVSKPKVVEKDFLDDENGHCFAQLGSSLHDSKAQRYNLRGKKKVDHIGRVVLDESTDDPQRGEAKIFKRS